MTHNTTDGVCNDDCRYTDGICDRHGMGYTHNTSDEEIVKEFESKNLLEWNSSSHSYQSGQQAMVDWLRTTLANVRQSEAKKREELLEKACGVLRNEEECKSGCGCATHTAYHEGSCVWVPKEYFTVEEVEATIKNLLDDNKNGL